jgi:hypothetical protein
MSSIKHRRTNTLDISRKSTKTINGFFKEELQKFLSHHFKAKKIFTVADTAVSMSMIAYSFSGIFPF